MAIPRGGMPIDEALDLARMAETRRMEAYQAANPWRPRGGPVAAQPPPADQQTAMINAAKAAELAQVAAQRRPASQEFSWAPDGGVRRPSPLVPIAPAPMVDQVEQINRRQELMAAQHTQPFDPGPGTMPYQRLETMPAHSWGDPRLEGDVHVEAALKLLPEGERPDWSVPVPGGSIPEA
jgi:hypothetical protein